MRYVFVLDKNKEPLMPTKPSRARRLLKAKKAKIYRLQPFTIILTKRAGGELQEVELKIDPGSKGTGIALVAHFKKRGAVLLWSATLNHRGPLVKKHLDKRRAVRHSRRARKTRYRPVRFLNRRRDKGWLPPSLLSRVNNIITWTRRLLLATPIAFIEVETVRFDTQKMQNAEISGVEYQQGELLGYEIREYLLEKFNRKCVYCKCEGIPLQIEHLIPKSRGGSNRVSNLAIACEKCNQKKGDQTALEFGYPEIEKQCKTPLRDTAAVNATRYRIGEELKKFSLPIRFWSGALTKKNRLEQGYKKEHWIDAACVGSLGSKVEIEETHKALEITAMGRGSRQMCRMDKHGFPRTKPKKKCKQVEGFQTGDFVRANVNSGVKAGKHLGVVAVRASGSFNIKTDKKTIQGISYKNCTLLQKVDGYAYS